MPDIYDRDFNRYGDDEFRADVDALVRTQVAEGATLEYKADLSEKGGWLQDLVAFANSYGGIIIVGVTAPKGIPETAPGFERQSEVALDITNQIIGCVQPRPDVQVKVVPLSANAGRWLAAIRVKEGTHPPYLLSRADTHRIYVRGSARKVEPDYLQLMSLIEKRRRIEDRSGAIDAEMLFLRNQVIANSVGERAGSFYRFVAVADPEVAQVLDNESERRFGNLVRDCFPRDREQMKALAETMPSGPLQWIRRPLDTTLSYYFIEDVGQKLFERRWLLKSGAVAFASAASHTFNGVEHFSLVDFVYDLVSFLRLLLKHFEMVGQFGTVHICADLILSSDLRLFDGPVLQTDSASFPHPSDCLTVGPTLQGQGTAFCRLDIQPITSDRMLGQIRSALNQIARGFGGVLRHDLEFLREVIDQLGTK
jgi:hypothetical protein